MQVSLFTFSHLHAASTPIMSSKCVLVLALAVLGAYAKPMLNTGFGSNGCTFRGNYGTTMPIINTQLRTPVVESFNAQIVPYSSQNSNSCQYNLKTVVSPQIHNDVMSDHVARAVSNSINRVPTFTPSSNVISGFSGDRSMSGVFQGNSFGSGIFTAQTTFPNCQNNNNGYSSLTTFSGSSGGVLGAPTLNNVGTSGSYPSNNMCSRSVCF